MFPTPPQKLQDERLYAKLYHAYLRTCEKVKDASGPQASITNSDVRLTPVTVRNERKFEKTPQFTKVFSPRICRHCNQEFPSGNALHAHIRNFKRSKLPSSYSTALRNNLNDPEDFGDPFLVVKNAENKTSVPKLISVIEESRNPSGLLPTGFIDSFFTGDMAETFSILEPPSNTFNPVFGDGKPKEKRNKFYIEAANQQLIDNDFVSYSGASFALPKEPVQETTAQDLLDSTIQAMGPGFDPNSRSHVASLHTLTSKTTQITPHSLTPKRTRVSDAATSHISPGFSVPTKNFFEVLADLDEEDSEAIQLSPRQAPQIDAISREGDELLFDSEDE